MNLLEGLTDGINRLVEHFTRWGVLLVAVGLAPGVALWPLAHYEELDFIINGKLDIDLRLSIVKWMIVSLAIIVGCYAAAYAWIRRQDESVTVSTVATGLNRYTFVLLMAPVMTGLMHGGIEAKHEYVTLTLIAVAIGFFSVFIYRLLERLPERSEPETTSWAWLPSAAVVGLFAFYAYYMSSLVLLDHRNLGTHIFDLGIYDNIFWHNANGDFMGCSYCKTGKHMSSHFDPILYVLSSIYRFYPRAETILILQSVWLATGVFPLYLTTKRVLRNPWLGVVLSAVYVLYPALHGANMFDFHSLTLVIPTLMWIIYSIDTRANVLFVVALVLMLMTREDMSLLACFIGAYAILQKRPILGLLTIVVSLAYFVTTKQFVMADPGIIMEKSASSTSFHKFYSEMIPHEEEGVKGLVITLLTDPVFFVRILLKPDKVFYFGLLLVPLCFLPFASGPKRVMMLYGLIFIGASSRKYVYSIHFQYSSGLFPILLMALPDGIDRVVNSRRVSALGFTPRRLRWTLVWTCLVATLLTTHKFGGMWPNASFRAGWNRLDWFPSKERQERYVFVRDLIDHYIPPDASVSAASALGAQLSNRETIMKWPRTKDADYILVSTKKLSDKSDKRIARLLRNGTFRLVAERYSIGLYERVPKDEQAAQRAKQSALRKEAAVKQTPPPMERTLAPDEEDVDDEEFDVVGRPWDANEEGSPAPKEESKDEQLEGNRNEEEEEDPLE